MFRKILILGAVSGILAGIASIIYAKVYNSSLGSDFPMVSSTGIIVTSLMGCLLAAVGYYFFSKLPGRSGEIAFNLTFMILTFLSILGPFATVLPLEIETPELFPGLTIPMHFFPALAWFTLKPLFPVEKGRL